jgi:ketosteroid isomerase-like protein
MSDNDQQAARPEDLSRLFVERANAGDVDGLVALYEPDAVLAFPPGQVTTGGHAIRQAYERLLADRPAFTAGEQQPALRHGDRRSPRPVWLVVEQPLRWLGASRMAPGCG